MKVQEIAFLFAIGAVGGLIGDAGSVQSGVTVYLPGSGPTIWESAWWFPILVGLGTVGTGFARLALGPVREDYDYRIGVGAYAAVIGIYAMSSLAFGIQTNDAAAKVALCASAAVLLAVFIADNPGVACGLLAAMAGPAVEIFIVGNDWSAYSSFDDGLLGVALWLPALYFAFGVAVARITELMVARRSSAA